MDTVRTQQFVSAYWKDSVLPGLMDFIRIPNKSPLYDPQWRETGHMDRAISLVERWCLEQRIRGLVFEVVRPESRTPLLFLDIPGDGPGCVLLYGHLDKQPEMTGWREGLGPWDPVIEEGRLYGRGGVDDGYAVFAALSAIRALEDQQVPHARCVILIETCEESGSIDLPFYIERLRAASESPASSSASTRAAATTISCGAPTPCAAWWWEI